MKLSKDEILKKANASCKNTLMETIHIKFVDAGEDFVIAKMPVTNKVHQPDGVLHGGATVALADIAGVSLAITQGHSAKSYVGFGKNTSAAENSRTVAGNAAFNIAVSDVVTVGIDGLSATISGTAYGVGNLVAFITAIQAKWNSNYVTGIVKSATTVKWLLTSDSDQFGAALANPTKSLIFTARDKGTPAIGVVPTVTITVASNTNTNLGYIIGNSQSKTNATADNGASGTALMLKITADTAGETLSEIGNNADGFSVAAKGAAVVFAGSGNATELLSTYKPNGAVASSAAATALNIFPTQSRSDVVNGEEANAAVASNAVSYTRVGWL